MIPSDPETYCKWYEYTRRHRNIEECEAENIMLILFEDMIYNYDETIKQIENRLGINRLDHIHPKTKFIPERSINNTQIWRRLNLTEIQQNELSYIENNLRCYLYNFPKIEIKKTSHIE